jgi:hypothetical protein
MTTATASRASWNATFAGRKRCLTARGTANVKRVDELRLHHAAYPAGHGRAVLYVAPNGRACPDA